MGTITALFPLWAVALSALAAAAPGVFRPFAPHIPILLGVVMLAMGLTLDAKSFGAVLRRPRVTAAGTVMQFTLMPLLALAVARLLGLPSSLEIGLVLVGCCPGGTASNVVAYLAGGDVALSITLTTVSTLLSVVLTPALAWLVLGREVDVPVPEMLRSVLTVVLLPVAAGAAVNHVFGRRLERVVGMLPVISVACIVLIIAIIVALSRERLAEIGPVLVLAVVLHNGLGLLAGYGAARALGVDERDRRTLCIEVGMQNSGLGVVLASQYFGTLAAVPGAVFSIWHNLSGAALASFWSRHTDATESDRRG